MRPLFKIEHQCLICNLVAAAFAIVVAGPLTLWAIDRTPAYEIVSVGRAEPNPVEVGQPLDLVREVMVNRENCEAWFNREIVDSTGYVWTFPVTTSTFARFHVGHYPAHSVTSFVVPHGVAEGVAQVYSNIWSICNPLQKLFPVYRKTPPLNVTILRSSAERGAKGEPGARGARGPKGEDAPKP